MIGNLNSWLGSFYVFVELLFLVKNRQYAPKTSQ